MNDDEAAVGCMAIAILVMVAVLGTWALSWWLWLCEHLIPLPWPTDGR